jgi:hypothetical protein
MWRFVVAVLTSAAFGCVRWAAALGRASALAATLALAVIAPIGNPLPAQQGDWSVGVGLGGAPNPHRQKGSSAVAAEIGRRIVSGRNAALGVSAIGVFFIPQTDYVCDAAPIGTPCDLRVFSGFTALAAWGEARFSHGEWKYYARAGAGPWRGGDVDASPGQSAAERGGLVTLELGSRDGRIDVGIEQKRLEGTRFGMIPLMNVVVRVSF